MAVVVWLRGCFVKKGALTMFRVCIGFCLWKNIRKGWDNFNRFVSSKVGDGPSIRFGHDSWCGGLPLRESFPKPFGIARNKDASVEELVFYRGKSPLGCKFYLAVLRLGIRVSCLFYRSGLFWADKTGWSGYALLESIFMEGFWSQVLL